MVYRWRTRTAGQNWAAHEWVRADLLWPTRLDGIDLTPDATEADRNAVFADNVAHLKQAQLVVAVIDDFDTGTIWETGTAFGLDIPVAYYAETLADGTFNVMLAKSGKATIQNMADLKAFLQEPTSDAFQYTGAIR